MFSKFFTFSVSAFIVLLFSSLSFGQVFTDDFEAYTVGGQLVCQDSVNWTTWSNLPCDPIEDAYISNNYAYSGTNAVVIVSNNDVLAPVGTQTSGKWDIGFMFYIPAGKAGYFNCQARFFGTPRKGAMHAFFDTGGTGELYAGSPAPIPFNYLHDIWQVVRVVVDLDNDFAECWIAGVLVHSWQWTLGPIGAGVPLQLDAVDFWGEYANNEMYVDDFTFDQIVSVENEEILNEYVLNQNYPNPFNPATTIKYQIPELSFVSLKVFGVLGNEIATLVNEEKHSGSYEAEFDATTFPSGVYFYRLQAGSFIDTKKMILLK